MYKLLFFFFGFRIALSYVKQTFNVQLYQEIVKRMTEAWLVIFVLCVILYTCYLLRTNLTTNFVSENYSFVEKNFVTG